MQVNARLKALEKAACCDTAGGSAEGAWLLAGNEGTDGGTADFFGTTDNVDVVFKRNDTAKITISNTLVTIDSGLKIVDGSEGDNKHLVSDTDGVATWQYAVKPNVRTFTTTQNYTPTTGTNYIKIQAVGAGGGSGAISSTSQKFSMAGGGGAYVEGFMDIGDIAAPLAITIGAAGAAGTAAGNGGHGGTTTVVDSATTTLISCQGGRRGDGELTATSVGGLGGNTFTVNALVEEVTRRIGEPGGVGSTTIRSGADGGSTLLGYGGKGESATNSVAPTGYGAGGHGVYGNATASVGIAGTAGVVIITEYFN